MRTSAGALYFAIVFAAGFALGTVRVLWLVPRLGERMAELAEMPFMLAVTMLAAHRVARRLSMPYRCRPRRALAMGLIGWRCSSRSSSPSCSGCAAHARGVLRHARPVSGTIYCAMLGVFALMPLLVARK